MGKRWSRTTKAVLKWSLQVLNIESGNLWTGIFGRWFLRHLLGHSLRRLNIGRSWYGFTKFLLSLFPFLFPCSSRISLNPSTFASSRAVSWKFRFGITIAFRACPVKKSLYSGQVMALIRILLIWSSFNASLCKVAQKSKTALRYQKIRQILSRIIPSI